MMKGKVHIVEVEKCNCANCNVKRQLVAVVPDTPILYTGCRGKSSHWNYSFGHRALMKPVHLYTTCSDVSFLYKLFLAIYKHWDNLLHIFCIYSKIMSFFSLAFHRLLHNC